MNIWHELDEKRVSSKDFMAVIEISKGSKNKYELDKESGMLVLDRVLHASMTYPANYGFIPKTYSEDNDPLDVLVLCSEPIVPLSLVRCTPIGVMYMTDGGENDEKIIAVAKKDPFFNGIRDIKELPDYQIKEIEHFFSFYKKLENKETQIEGTAGKEKAEKVIETAISNYKKTFSSIL